MKKNVSIILCLTIFISLLTFMGFSCSEEAHVQLAVDTPNSVVRGGVYGDVNSDGKVSPLDASLVLQYNASLIKMLDNIDVADVNGDGKISPLDASLILQYNASLISSFQGENRTVSFDLNYDGSLKLESQTVKYGTTAIEPESPTREGYSFNGWYTETDCANEYSFSSLVYSSFTLYAGWSSEDESSDAETSVAIDSSTEDPSSEEESRVTYPEGSYIVKRFDTSDITWEEVPKANIDIYKWVDSVEYEAYAQLVYIEDEGFICKMTCMESDPLALYTQYGDPVYLDSCMEFFAAWDNVSYINIESNSNAALCVQFGKQKKNRKDATEFLSLDEMFKVTPQVEENYWTLTMDIPLSKLQKFYPALSEETFVSGYTFKGNFYKIGSDPVNGTRHYGMWNEVKTTTADFHQPSYFGTLVIE